MLPFQHKKNDLWTRETLLQACNLSNAEAGLKKLERLVSEARYFPPIINVAEITDEDGHPLQKI